MSELYGIGWTRFQAIWRCSFYVEMGDSLPCGTSQKASRRYSGPPSRPPLTYGLDRASSTSRAPDRDSRPCCAQVDMPTADPSHVSADDSVTDTAPATRQWAPRRFRRAARRRSRPLCGWTGASEPACPEAGGWFCRREPGGAQVRELHHNRSGARFKCM